MVQAKPAPTRRGTSAEQTLLPLPKDTVAEIDGVPIGREVFDTLLALRMAEMRNQREDGKVPVGWQRYFRKQVSRRLVWETLVRLECERRGLDFDHVALEDWRRAQNFANRARYLARMLETESTLSAKMQAFYRERALLGDVSASASALAEAYDEIRPKLKAPEERMRAAHILVVLGPRNADASGQMPKIVEASPQELAAASSAEVSAWRRAAEQRAEQLRARAPEGGEDFMEFVRLHSEGPAAFRGGDMGVFGRERMNRSYADAAFGLQPGELSPPVADERGYYLIKSLGRYTAGETLPRAAVEDDLRRTIESVNFRRAKAALERELYTRYAVKNHVMVSIGGPLRRSFSEPQSAKRGTR